MKKTLSLVLVLVMIFTMVPSVSFAADETNPATEIYTTFEDYLKYSGTVKDVYVNDDVLVHTYAKITPTKMTPVAIYIINHGMERIGTEGDIPIITDLLEEYIVVVLDYQNSPDAISPNLEWGINEILNNRVNNGKVLGGLSYRKDYLYQIPAGCRVVKDILYFELDKHAPNGTINYIIDVWNTYYAGQKTDANGNLLPTATTIEECIKKDGTPIDLDLKLDIVYPSNPKEVVPVFMLASSAETSRSTAKTIDRPVYTGMLLNGYAAVCYDHEYIPMSRNDHYGYLDKAFTLYKFTANRSHSAAVRRVRQLADQYGYDAEYMGNWGFSKSSTGPAWLSDKTHLEKGEIDYFADKYNPNGESPYESPEEQPWLTYEDGTPISSNVTATYSGSGPGFHNHMSKTAPKTPEDAIPGILNSSGTLDTTGGFYKLWPPVYNYFVNNDIESLCIDIDNVAHSYPQGWDERRDMDYYVAYFDYFDNHIRAAYRNEPPKVLWTTPLDHSKHLSTIVPVEVKFSRAMDFDSVKNGVKVINEETGNAVGGFWNSYNGDTRFEFVSPALDVNTKYRIEVTEICSAKDGVHLVEKMVKSFKVMGTRTIDADKDAYIDSTNPDTNFGSETSVNVTSNDDVVRKAYIGFTSETGFSDVKSATLLIKGSDEPYSNRVYGLKDGQSWNENTITWNNAPANNTSGDGVISDNVYLGTNFAFAANDNMVTRIDVTEYLKSLSGNEATFVFENKDKETVTLDYDFEDMEEDGFKAGTHYRLGGQGTTTETVVTEDAYEGNKSLKFAGREYGNRRIKIYNALGTSALTDADIGSVYKVEAYVKPSKDDVLLVGMFSATGSNYGTKPYLSKSFDVYSDRWTYVSFDFAVEEGMLEEDVRLLGFETNTATDTLYFDNIKVTKVSNENNITSKEGETDVRPVARLVIDSSDNISNIIGDNVYIESGNSANKNLSSSEVLYVKGADSVNTDGMQKGYMRISLDGVDTASTVNLKFSVAKAASNNILVYGLDVEGLNKFMSYKYQGSEFGSAHAWTDAITWNSAPGNDKTGIGVVSEHQYGGAPIATIDASTVGEKTVDITSYVKAMKEEGASDATIVFAAQNQEQKHKLDFEGDVSGYEIKLSHSNSSYEIADGGADGTGKALRFIRVGTEANNGYYQNISIGNLLDVDNTWTADDIGKTVRVSFKAKFVASQYTENPATYKNTFAYTIATIGSQRDANVLGDSVANGKTIGTYVSKGSQSSDTWRDYELKFTITKDMLNSSDDYSKAALVFGANWGTKEVWIDDVNVEYYGGPVTISTGKTSDGETTTVKTYTFDEANCDISGITSQREAHTLSIAEGAGPDGSNALLFKKDAATFDNCFRIPYLLNENNLLTADDIGKTYSISYKVKIKRLDGYTTGTNNLLAKISTSDATNSDFGVNSTDTSTKSLGDSADTRDRTTYELDTWTDVNLTFTITSEMVESHSNRTYLVIGSYANIGYVYIDDIVSTVTDAAVSGPLLELVAEDETVTNGEITYMNTVAASTPNTSYKDVLTIKREDYVDGAINGKKAYMQFVFDNTKVKLLKSANLIFDILSTPAKDTQTIDVYGFTDADYDKTEITWNNAPGNNTKTNGIMTNKVYEEAPIATVTPNKGKMSIDVSNYIKTLSNDEKAVFALVTDDTPNITTFFRDFEDGLVPSKPRDLRHGGTGSLTLSIAEENGNKYLAVTGNVQSSSRLKFKDVFSKPFFTTADKGAQYKVSYKIRPSKNASPLTGIMSSYETSSYGSSNDYTGGGYKGTVTLTANEWNTVEFIYTVNDITVNNMLNSLSIEPHTVGCTFDLDDIKVEKMMDGNEIEIDSDATLEISFDEVDNTENSAAIYDIVSSGDFNKGDSVLVNVLAGTAFTNKATGVTFFVNGKELEKAFVKNTGSIYSARLLNLDEGTYEVYAVVDFEEGESVTTDAETITISGNASYTDMFSEKTGELKNGSVYNVVKKVKSNLQNDVKAIAILGIYDNGGNLIKVVKSSETVIGAGRINTFKMNTGTLEDIPVGAYAKVMVWSNFTDILPCVSGEILNW